MHFRAAPLIVLIAATSACGAGSGPVTTDAPTPFSASSTSAPEGFTAAECPGVVDEKESLADLNDELKEYEDIGIRVFWQNPDDIDQRLDDLDIVLDSIELIRS